MILIIFGGIALDLVVKNVAINKQDQKWLAVVLGVMFIFGTRHDRSDGKITVNFFEQLLRSIPEGSILMTKGTLFASYLSYNSFVLGMRKDVNMVRFETIANPTYVNKHKWQFSKVSLQKMHFKTPHQLNSSDVALTNIKKYATFFKANGYRDIFVCPSLGDTYNLSTKIVL